jgi:prolyl-tRNA synthetase
MEGEGGGGFADIYWCGNPACETRIREETKATCRAIPIEQNTQPGKCLVCGEPATERVFFAKSY